MNEFCENEECLDRFPGRPCSVCEKNTCVSCDTYYLVVNQKTGEYITEPNDIMRREGTLAGFVAHQKCVDPELRLD